MQPFFYNLNVFIRNTFQPKSQIFLVALQMVYISGASLNIEHTYIFDALIKILLSVYI